MTLHCLFLFLLFTFGSSNVLDVECEKACKEINEMAANQITKNIISCCFEDNLGQNCENETGPPTKPPTALQIYKIIRLQLSGSVAGFNIVWFQDGNVVLEDTCGYFLYVSVSSMYGGARDAKVYFRLTTDTSPNRQKQDFEKVKFSFNFFGNISGFSGYVYPGQYGFKLLSNPSSTENYIFGSYFLPEEPGTKNLLSGFTEPNNIIVNDADENSEGLSVAIIVILVFVGLAVLGILSLIWKKQNCQTKNGHRCLFYYGTPRRKNQAKKQADKNTAGQELPPRFRLFVAISSRDMNTNSKQSRDADQMCCFFQQRNMQVTYTLWHATRLSQTDAVLWINDQIEKANHVILVLTSNSEAGVDDNLESEALLNKAFDPYTLVLKTVEHKDVCTEKYSFVYFEHDVTLPSNSFVNSSPKYRLPDDALKLCRRLLKDDDDMGRELQKYLHKENAV